MRQQQVGFERLTRQLRALRTEFISNAPEEFQQRIRETGQFVQALSRTDLLELRHSFENASSREFVDYLLQVDTALRDIQLRTTELDRTLTTSRLFQLGGQFIRNIADDVTRLRAGLRDPRLTASQDTAATTTRYGLGRAFDFLTENLPSSAQKHPNTPNTCLLYTSPSPRD